MRDLRGFEHAELFTLRGSPKTFCLDILFDDFLQLLRNQEMRVPVADELGWLRCTRVGSSQSANGGCVPEREEDSYNTNNTRGREAANLSLAGSGIAAKVLIAANLSTT